jgi:hypothetical protein
MRKLAIAIFALGALSLVLAAQDPTPIPDWVAVEANIPYW